MTSRGEVGRIAEDSVCAPDHDVRNARGDVESAARTDVGLHGLSLGDRLNVPLASAAHLGATPSCGETLDVEFRMRLTSTGRSAP